MFRWLKKKKEGQSPVKADGFVSVDSQCYEEVSAGYTVREPVPPCDEPDMGLIMPYDENEHTVELVCTEGEHKGKMFALHDGDWIGRKEPSAILLSGRFVSRRQCKFIYRENQWFVQCTGGYFTEINGIRHESGSELYPLENGTVLTFFDQVFEVRLQADDE